MNLKKGAGSGPNSCDKGKPRTKRRVITDRQGIPLAVVLGPANRHDTVAFEPLPDAVPRIRTPARHRRHRPTKPHADKAYDIPALLGGVSGAPHRAANQSQADRLERDAGAQSLSDRAHTRVYNQYRLLIIRYERRFGPLRGLQGARLRVGCWNYLTRWL
jgi:hypothetical protein